MSGNIIRVEKPEKYAIVSQDMLRDSRLSFAARGLLAYLLSKPANWSMQTEDLISQSPAGRDAIYSMLKELEVNGYLKRERVRDEKGHVHWETTVYELPELAAEPNTAFPDTVCPDTVRPNTEKPHHKKYRVKELSKEERTTTSVVATRTKKPPSAVSVCREVTGRSPNQKQRSDITAQVTNLPHWRRTLEKFMLEGQPPQHVDWMLERYHGKGKSPPGKGEGWQSRAPTIEDLACADGITVEEARKRYAGRGT